MLTTLHLNEKSREVCIKTRSPPASLAFVGQVTEDTTVKRPITNVNKHVTFILLVPSLAPSNVTAWAMNSSSIFVSWGPIPSEGRNGIIIGYGLFYTKHDALGPDWKQKYCNNTYGCAIASLDMYTRYGIRVTGLTDKGFGVAALVDAVTEKGGKFS